MGLRDDIDAMERHSRNGTLKEFFEGTAPILSPADDFIPDPSAKQGLSNYNFIKARD